MNNFIDNGEFPSRIQWKQIVIQCVRMVYEQKWRDEICSHLQLGIYAVVHQRCEASKRWLPAKRSPCYLEYITDVVQIMCASLTIAGKRVADPEVHTENCSRCCILYRKPMQHALLYRREKETERNILWALVFR